MSKKTLKFDDIEVDKKEFHKCKQLINLNLVNINSILISDKFKHSDDALNTLLVTKKMIL